MSANTNVDQKIEVVGLVLVAASTHRVVVFRRGPQDSGAGYWEFPGGKVDRGESKEQALVREIDEELKFSISKAELIFIGDIIHQYPSKKIHLHLFGLKTSDENIKFQLIDHDDFKWVDSSEFKQIYFSPADLALIPKVISFLNS